MNIISAEVNRDVALDNTAAAPNKCKYNTYDVPIPTIERTRRYNNIIYLYEKYNVKVKVILLYHDIIVN